MRKQLKQCADMITETLIDQSAYIQADAAAKCLNLARYKTDIRKEMKSKVKKSSKCNDSHDKKSGIFITICSVVIKFAINQLEKN